MILRKLIPAFLLACALGLAPVAMTEDAADAADENGYFTFQVVPDSGTTVSLMGFAILAVAFAKWRLSKVRAGRKRDQRPPSHQP